MEVGDATDALWQSCMFKKPFTVPGQMLFHFLHAS